MLVTASLEEFLAATKRLTPTIVDGGYGIAYFQDNAVKAKYDLRKGNWLVEQSPVQKTKPEQRNPNQSSLF